MNTGRAVFGMAVHISNGVYLMHNCFTKRIWRNKYLIVIYNCSLSIRVRSRNNFTRRAHLNTSEWSIRWWGWRFKIAYRHRSNCCSGNFRDCRYRDECHSRCRQKCNTGVRSFGRFSSSSFNRKVFQWIAGMFTHFWCPITHKQRCFHHSLGSKKWDLSMQGH